MNIEIVRRIRDAAWRDRELITWIGAVTMLGGLRIAQALRWPR